jgi:hypothetical protein
MHNDSKISLSSLEEYFDTFIKNSNLETIFQDLKESKPQPPQIKYSKYCCTRDLIKTCDTSTTMSFLVGNKMAKKKFLCLPMDNKLVSKSEMKENNNKIQSSSSKNTMTINKHFKIVKTQFFTKILQFNNHLNIDDGTERKIISIKDKVLQKNFTEIDKKSNYHAFQLCSSDTLIHKHKRKKQKALYGHITSRSSSH